MAQLCRRLEVDHLELRKSVVDSKTGLNARRAGPSSRNILSFSNNGQDALKI